MWQRVTQLADLDFEDASHTLRLNFSRNTSLRLPGLWWIRISEPGPEFPNRWQRGRCWASHSQKEYDPRRKYPRYHPAFLCRTKRLFELCQRPEPAPRKA